MWPSVQVLTSVIEYNQVREGKEINHKCLLLERIPLCEGRNPFRCPICLFYQKEGYESDLWFVVSWGGENARS